jgi:hypothetical protein
MNAAASTVLPATENAALRQFRMKFPPPALHVENLKAHDCGDFVADVALSEARSSAINPQ